MPRIAKIETKSGEILEVEFDVMEKHFDGSATLYIISGLIGLRHPVAEIPKGTLFVITNIKK